MQVHLRGKRVAVEKLKQATKKKDDLFVMPEGAGEEYYGTIVFLGPDVSDLKVGQKVYFGTQHQLVRMAGTELCIMEDANVLASVNE